MGCQYPHNDDEILDFLQDTNMIDAFDDFFDECPATHINGSKQINLISFSHGLAPFINDAFILDPKDGKGDHLYIGIDLDFGLLTSHDDLSNIDPGHCQNRILVSTNVKALQSHLEQVKQKNDSHNIMTHLCHLFQ